MTDMEREASHATTRATTLTSRELRFALGGLSAAVALPAMNATIVSTALPAIGADLGSLSQLPWVVTTYVMSSAVAVPIVGKLSDIHGRRTLFSATISLFVIGSLLCAFAQTFPQLVVARAVQGAGGGAIVSLTFASMGDVIPARQRARYQGYTYVAMASASVAGPLIGGILVDRYSWRWIFLIDVPLGLVSLWAVLRNLRIHHTPPDRQPLDLAGGVLLSLTIIAGFFAIGWGGSTYPWTSPAIVMLCMASAAAAIAFGIVEIRHPDPIVPLALFRNDIVAVCCAVGFLIQGAVYSAIVFVPIFLQTVTAATATGSAVLLVPLIGSMLITNLISGRLISRWGHYRLFPVVGTVLSWCGFVLLSEMSASTTARSVFVYTVLVGAGVGMINQVLVLAAQNAVPKRMLGVVTSGVQFCRMLGSTVALVVLGAILDSRLGGLTWPEDGRVPAGAGETSNALGSPGLLDMDTRVAMSDAFTDLFLVSAAATTVAFGLTLLLRSRPLDDTDPSSLAPAETASCVAAHESRRARPRFGAT